MRNNKIIVIKLTTILKFVMLNAGKNMVIRKLANTTGGHENDMAFLQCYFAQSLKIADST